MTDRHTRSNGQGQGMNWIRPVKRLAIYLRDGLACVYCGATVEDGARLTLDHLRAHSQGGSNRETNLVTCCLTCNSGRGNRRWKLFAAKVAAYLNQGVTAHTIITRIEVFRYRPLDLKAAQELINRRGSFKASLRREEVAHGQKSL